MDYKTQLDSYRILPVTPSRVYSRSHVTTWTSVNEQHLQIPAIVPGMRGIVSQKLIDTCENYGVPVILPRNTNFHTLNHILNVSMDSAERFAEEINFYDGILSIEIANGHMEELGQVIKRIRRKYSELRIWAGTVATAEGVRYLANCGATAVLVGIGIGSACTTTLKTGVGLPLVETLQECTNVDKTGTDVPIILTGGLRKPADFIKALLLGADACMIGALLRGCSDLAEPDLYYGMASEKEKQFSHKPVEYIEGIVEPVEAKPYTSYHVLKDLEDSLRSAMSYCDSMGLTEFRGKAKLVKVDL